MKDGVSWTLLTNIPVESFQEAVEKVEWYKQRWNIEVYFKTLKSGFGVEEVRLRHIDRIKKYVSFMSVLAWRVFWLSKVSREAPDAKADICFTKEQQKILVRMGEKKSKNKLTLKSSSQEFVRAVAKLGGYLGRNSDPPPGQIVIWRGLMRFNDIILGSQLCG